MGLRERAYSFNVFSDSPDKLAKCFRKPSPTMHRATNVTFQDHHVTQEQRAINIGKHDGFRGCTIWFTGLSGAGKTTIAFALEATLNDLGIASYGLDGDNMRHGVCANLGFSPADREENIRRVAEVSRLFADAGMVTLASFISPYQKDRDIARKSHEAAGLPFIEVFVNTPLDVCEKRDVKGLYMKAREGKIKGFTGIDSPFEAPKTPELELHSHKHTVAECVQQVLELLYARKILPERAAHKLCGPPVRELFVAPEKMAAVVDAAKGYPRVDIDDVAFQWTQVLAEGWATPLDGFMRERQYLQALHFGQLLDTKAEGSARKAVADDVYLAEKGVNQSIPIVLAIDDAQKAAIGAHTSISLYYKEALIAVLSSIEMFAHRKAERCARTFACVDEAHPSIAMIMRQGDWCVGGTLRCISSLAHNDGLDEYRLRPIAIREKLADMGADAVFAFQLRNPIHNGHALLMRDTRDKLLKMGYKRPVLLLHPLGGWTKDDDVPLAVRMRQHHAVMDEGVLDASWTLLAVFPSPMLYAGPTEVQWHARARLAAGVSHYIVGRDPAGLKVSGHEHDLYESSHGSKVLSMAPGLPDLSIIPFRVASYNIKAKEMQFFDPSRADEFLNISGTRMRAYARNGETPPEGFMAPKAWEILVDYYASIAKYEYRDICQIM